MNKEGVLDSLPHSLSKDSVTLLSGASFYKGLRHGLFSELNLAAKRGHLTMRISFITA
ncbi:hypothetical protein BN1200_1070021 [Klebsiella variicola]|nr:hypothetical protein BN1200_1070021 [Klebsiella variicola]